MTGAAALAGGLRRGHGAAGTAVLALAAASAALWVAADSGVEGPAALPDVLRAGAAAVALFAVAGYAPARLLAPAAMAPQLPLLVLPLGAVVSALWLTALGFLSVPIEASLVSLAVCGVGPAAAVRLRLSRARPSASSGESAREARVGPVGGHEGALRRLGWPAYLAVLAAAIALVPVFRSGIATVVGQNGDAYLAVGSAELLQHAHPTAIEPDLPVDRVPLVWRSKYPIYYSLAGVSSISGLHPIETFATLSALLLALTGLGWYLFARHGLGVGHWPALAAGGLVPLDRIALHVADHPFYNQLWGQFALPFMLLFGWLYLRDPSRAALALLVLFAAIGAFAHPLMLFLPGVALPVAALLVWRRRRAQGEPVGWLSALQLPRSRRSLRGWIPVALLAAHFASVLGRGVAEKIVSAIPIVFDPGRRLWGSETIDYLPLHRFFGLTDVLGAGDLLVVVLLAAAVAGLRRAPRELALGLVAAIAVAFLFALSFRLRDQGALFHFKTLGYLGPLVVALAVAGLAGLAGLAAARTEPLRTGGGGLAGRAGAIARAPLRATAAGALALLAVVFVVNAGNEMKGTFDQVTPELLELRSWSDRLPEGASVRVDVPPSGTQLWTTYMLHEHPLSASEPLGEQAGFFPYPPKGRRADYLLAASGSRPADADGPPLLESSAFRLYRMRPGVPGRDLSSTAQVDAVTRITLD